MIHQELTPVTRDVFYAYLEDISITREQGETTHSSYFYNLKKECIAYIETSSYGAETIYKVKNPLHRTNPKDTLYFK